MAGPYRPTEGRTMRRATIYSIASTVGVSPSTVSRAFSRPEMVKSELREKILTTARELGYAPNRAARGLATARTGATGMPAPDVPTPARERGYSPPRAARGLATARPGVIGLLVPDVANPFFPPLIRAVQDAARQKDAELLLIDSELSVNAEQDLVDRIRPQVDGLIIASPRLPSKQLHEVLRGMPAVIVNRSVRGLPGVVCDNTPALQEIADHLHELGHRRIALLRGPRAAWAATHRAKAVRTWAEGKDAELVELGPIEAQFADGRAAAQQVADSGATAVFA